MRRLFAAPRRPIQWTPDEARARDASLVDVKRAGDENRRRFRIECTPHYAN